MLTSSVVLSVSYLVSVLCQTASSDSVCAIPAGMFDGMVLSSNVDEPFYGTLCNSNTSQYVQRFVMKCLPFYCCDQPCVCGGSSTSDTNNCPNPSTVVSLSCYTKYRVIGENAKICCNGYIEDELHVCRSKYNCSINNGGCDQLCRHNATTNRDYCDCNPGYTRHLNGIVGSCIANPASSTLPGATTANSGVKKVTTIVPGATSIHSGMNKVTTVAPGAATTANTGINKIISMAGGTTAINSGTNKVTTIAPGATTGINKVTAGATATKFGTNKVTTIAPGVTTVTPVINKVTAGATATKFGTNKVTTIAPGGTTVNLGINKVTTKVPGILVTEMPRINSTTVANGNNNCPMATQACRFIKTNDNSAPSGEYQIGTSFGKTIKVYCEMGLNGGGYTFIRPFDWPSLSNAELQAMFQDRSSLLLRARRTNGTQPYGILKQLSSYSNLALNLGLNSNTPYNDPLNYATMGKPFVSFGFHPPSIPANNNIQGVQCNNVNITFANCPSVSNSYIALFADFNEAQEASVPTSNPDFINQVFGNLVGNPSGRGMPLEYFTFAEFQFGQGTCAHYTTTERLTSTIGVLSVAIGIR